ncbi:MAG: hypothetical protein M1830_007023 [Pleopsidium flavum]|nr:MAG: hypothetical protein M1830_007038 [Pleopsidium flavum]KAI9876216.1 MAG: hypothetical protein M1830_007023 [Pleopsidium flavum]
MANRYKPPQKRTASAQNYFSILTSSEDEPTTPTTHLAQSGPTHSSDKSMSQAMQSSNLRGDSMPYTPVQQSRNTSLSTLNRQIPSLNLDKTSQPKTPATAARTSSASLSRSFSPLPLRFSATAQHNRGRTMSPKPSVKHLTCYFWNEFGRCQWSDEECLYAHEHTGKVASAPVQVEVGKPAVAGRNAEAAKPRYEDWRTVEGGMSSSPARSGSAQQGDEERTEEAAGCAGNVEVLSDAVSSLSSALHYQQLRVVGVKEALVDHCNAMLALAHWMTRRGMPIDELVEKTEKLVESVAEHGRSVEQIGELLGQVSASLDDAGLHGVMKRQ